MKGLIYREPADLLETGERLKGNEPGINTPIHPPQNYRIPSIQYITVHFISCKKLVQTFTVMFCMFPELNSDEILTLMRSLPPEFNRI